MGKISRFLHLSMLPLLMATSVEKVDSSIDEEATNEVHFPKLSVDDPFRDYMVYIPSDESLFEHFQDGKAELMDLRKSKKSFASFRIRPQSDCIYIFIEL